MSCSPWSLGLVSSWLVFLWVFARLPREPVTWRSAIRAAIGAAVGLEVIKRVMVVYLATVTQTPAGAAFGPILGLLIFIFTVSQFVLFLTAWAATARENQVERPPPVPPPAVIRQEVTMHRRPRAGRRREPARRRRRGRAARVPLAGSSTSARSSKVVLGRYEAAGLPDLGEHLIGDPVLEALRVGQPLHMISR